MGTVTVATPASRARVSAPVFFKMDGSLETGHARVTLPAGALSAAELRALTGVGTCPAPFSADERVKVGSSRGAVTIEVPAARLGPWRQADVPLLLGTKAGPPLMLTLKPHSLKADVTAAEVANATKNLARYEACVVDAKKDLAIALQLQANPPPIERAGELAALEPKLQAAQTLVAYRLGGARATVLTSKAPVLAVAASLLSGDVARAGRALTKANNEAIALGDRQAQLERRLSASPGDASIARDLALVSTKREAADREVRGGTREVQRLLLGVDVEQLARAEPVLRPSLPTNETLRTALVEAQLVRNEVESLREGVRRAVAEQPRLLAGKVRVAKDSLANWERLVADTKALLDRLTTNPLVEDVPRVVR
ncbi:MAG: hypothetical protein JNJ54_15180 [Myxococcaceae bacterium]|nr:hypothetical protein [Myxococcaceae bacterium]